VRTAFPEMERDGGDEGKPTMGGGEEVETLSREGEED